MRQTYMLTLLLLLFIALPAVTTASVLHSDRGEPQEEGPGRGDDLARIEAWRAFLDRAHRAFFAARMSTTEVKAQDRRGRRAQLSLERPSATPIPMKAAARTSPPTWRFSSGRTGRSPPRRRPRPKCRSGSARRKRPWRQPTSRTSRVWSIFPARVPRLGANRASTE